MSKFFIAALAFICFGANSSASNLHEILDGQTLQVVQLSAVAKEIPNGGIVIVSEQHGYFPHHANQKKLLQELANAQRGPISVGMEFFSRPFQPLVDQFLSGTLLETEFLKLVDWGGDKFDNYRAQVLFPASHDGKTLALNASRSLTGKIKKVGISGLTEEEREQLPAGFALGNANYFDRFKEVMAHHVPPEALQYYFEAQSVWDDTMAKVAADFLKKNPEQRLEIIVGDFHAQYGGGLPDRLKARGVKSVTTISQVNTTELTEEEIQSEIKVDEKYGARGDYIWIE